MSSIPEPPTGASGQPEPDPSGRPTTDDRRRVVVVVLACVVALAVAAAVAYAGNRGDDTKTASGPSRPSSSTAASPSATDSAPMPATDAALGRFYDQKLKWHDCGRDKCALLTVPLDYDNPGAKSIQLAVLKVPAQGHRIGSLVVNPGGPGGSGVQYAAAGSLQFGNELSDAYDIVGFDPRGVGQSDPVKCIDTAQLDRLVAFDPDPDTDAERNEMDRLIHQFGQGCLDHSGDLARHMST